MKALRVAIAVALALTLAAVTSADVTPEPLRRAKTNSDKVRDYSADAMLTIDGPEVHVKNMKCKVYFKQPDKLKIQAKEGFAFLPKENMALGDPVRDILANYRISSAGTAKIAGRNTQVLKATPRAKDISVPPMTLWVDEQRGLIVQSETRFMTDQIGRARITYTLIDKKYWMPSRVITESVGQKQPAAEQRSIHGTRRARDMSGKMTLELTNYRVNRGISHDVFQQAEPARK